MQDAGLAVSVSGGLQPISASPKSSAFKLLLCGPDAGLFRCSADPTVNCDRKLQLPDQTSRA
jgi:hypothetical protein